jgi:bifunctional lysine-specific demethylase and histidyl-hydroxylase NO66
VKDWCYWLLGIEQSSFFADVYEQAPLVASGADTSKFHCLLTIARLDERLAELDLRAGMVELASSRHSIERSDYVEPNGVVDRVALVKHYRNGATIICNQLQHNDKVLADFARELERVFYCHVQTNIYLTPPGEQGFRTHYDTHDVLVLQVEGEKHWQFYGDPVAPPYRGEQFVASGSVPEEPTRSFVLRAGDCVYIPRGFFHAAANQDQEKASLHITVGLIVRTWADLVLEAMSEACLSSAPFRKALPRGFAAEGFSPGDLEPTFSTLLRQLAAEAKPDNALAQIAETFIRTREPDISGAIAQNQLSSEATYRASESLRRIETRGEAVVVTAPGVEFVFSRAPEELVRQILSGRRFTIPDLLHGDAENVVRRLMSAGLVRRVADPATLP